MRLKGIFVTFTILLGLAGGLLTYSDNELIHATGFFLIWVASGWNLIAWTL